MSTTTVPAAAPAAPALSPFRMLPLGRLKESPQNNRRHFDVKALEELTASIRQRGVLTPLLVRPSGADFEIAAGHRRYRGAKAAGNVVEVPCVVREMSDAEFLEVIVIENLQREDIHEMDEANGYQDLIKKHKYTVETIAKKVGKSESYIYQRLKLAELIADAQKLFMTDEITAGHAILIARESESGQKAILKDGLYYRSWQRGGSDAVVVVSVRSLSDWIQRELHLDLKKALFDVNDGKLVAKAGSCLNCPKRTGGAAGVLFPDLAAGSDVCTDRQCYNLKLTAHINAQVSAGQAVRLTTDYSERKNAGMYYLDDHDRYTWDQARWARKAAKKCDYTYAGIYVDGQERGKVLDVCINLSCKLHFPRKSETRTQNQSTPAQRLANAKQSIDIQMASELRKRLCAAALEKLSACSGDLVKVSKKPALALVAKLVFDRFDHQVRNHIHEELKLGGGIDKFVAKLSTPAIQAFIIQMVLINLSMGFTAGFYSRSDAAREALGEIAEQFGVKAKPIEQAVAVLKKEKLAQAQARHAPKVQTSAKSKTKAKKPGKAA